jgi:hypothetical protein
MCSIIRKSSETDAETESGLAGFHRNSQRPGRGRRGSLEREVETFLSAAIESLTGFYARRPPMFHLCWFSVKWTAGALR